MKWEFIKTIEHGVLSNREHIKRMKVPGGWLVKYMDVSGLKSPVRHAMLYVPDYDGLWDIIKEPVKLEQFIIRKTPNYNERTCRFKVPGGWVILDGHYGGGQSHISLALLPDPAHQWELMEEEKE